MCGLFMIVPMAMFIILQIICKDECECEKKSVINLPSFEPVALVEVLATKIEEFATKVEEVLVVEDMKLAFVSNVLFNNNNTSNHTKIYEENIQISGGRNVVLRIFS